MWTGRGWPVLVGAIFLALALALLWVYQERLKEAFLPRTAERLGFRYDPEGIPWEEVASSGLLPPPERWARADLRRRGYESEDQVEGEVEGLPLVSADIHLWRGRWAFPYYRFRGRVYRFRLPGKVAGSFRVAPKGALSYPGRVNWALLAFVPLGLLLVGGLFLYGLLRMSGKSLGEVLVVLWPMVPFFLFVLGYLVREALRFRPREGLRVDHPGFNRYFQAFGEGPIPLPLAEALVEAREALGRPFWGSVSGQDLWLALPGKGFRVNPFVPVERLLQREEERWKKELEEGILLGKALGAQEGNTPQGF